MYVFVHNHHTVWSTSAKNDQKFSNAKVTKKTYRFGKNGLDHRNLQVSKYVKR